MTIKNYMIKELDKIYERCKKSNWEGNFERAISKKTIENAKNILSFISPDTCDPTAVGQIEFNFKSDTHVLAIRIDEDSVLFGKCERDNVKKDNFYFQGKIQ